MIRRTVFSQAKIIDDLLDLSRLNTGKLQLNLGPVDWPALIQRIIPAVQADAQAKELVVGVAIEPRAVMIWADWVRVEQIVWNLLSNAVKFTRAAMRSTCASRWKATWHGSTSPTPAVASSRTFLPMSSRCSARQAMTRRAGRADSASACRWSGT